MSARLLAALEAQGCRCGHIDGKARCGQYVIGEEELESREAALENTRRRRDDWAGFDRVDAWQRGYEQGYRIGAGGLCLDFGTISHELPEDCS